jgi:hypothetical protein
MRPHIGPQRFVTCFVAAILCVLLAGCGTDFAQEKFGEIEEDMTVSEVEAILGPGEEIPWAEVESIVEEFPELGLTESTCEKWMMWGNRTTYGLVGFQDGKVCERLSR